MFVNLSVSDLERAKTFYTAVGFTINPLFTGRHAACVVVDEDQSVFMLLVRDYFQAFSDRPIGDPAATVSASTAVFFESPEAVDGGIAGGNIRRCQGGWNAEDLNALSRVSDTRTARRR